ncbi:DIP1984 family protein [Paenibacillus sp. FSL F4-0243]|uniref:DIP1984 family protein n=1 Tax=Paenibacillus sp. FSL F4-0243 TaxID=2954732 RepID=UPI0030D9EEE7
MKLAEALVNRSDLTRKIAQLKQRLERVVKVQEGEEPAEQPEALLQELERAVNEQTILIRVINRSPMR